MRKITIFTLITLIVSLMSGCGGKKEDSMGNETNKTLVLYYSQSGTTKAVAEKLQKELGSAIDSIVAVEPYGPDYNSIVARWRHEVEDSVKVEIKPLNVNINDYDTIFLGTPVWGGIESGPMTSFLQDNDLEGKTIITFVTFGSGGLESTTEHIAKLQPKSNIMEGYGVREARIAKAPKEIERFLIEKGFKKGEITPAGEYAEMNALTPEDIEIFNIACSSYPMPLGTPIEVATRDNNGIKEYKFKAIPENGDAEHHFTIYITPEDGTYVFTRVIR